MSPLLDESRLHTFIDEPREFALYFLEGQKLIHDLALLHGVAGDGFAYFREAVLSVQPMIALLGGGEQMGFYIDSQNPYFRLKLEANHQGDVRSVLVPEGFREFPERAWGLVRVQRLFPRGREPYTSVLRIDGLPLGAIVNRVLHDSYQVHCHVRVAAESDQSAMLHQLPPLAGKDAYDYSHDAVRTRGRAIAASLDGIFARALQGTEEIARAFLPIGFRHIAERPIRFRCGCSKARMVHHILKLADVDAADLFDPGQSALEITCEYCKTRYAVTREDLTRGGPH